MSAHDLSGIIYQGKADHSKVKVAIVVSKWNPEITEALFKGAKETLLGAGIPEAHISRLEVPGSYELPLGARMALGSQKSYDGVICIGCVIQGETRHFEFISQAVSTGIMQVGIATNKPVIFGVLTPDTMAQAMDRAGGKYGNKGQEAAVALLEMLDLKQDLQSSSRPVGF